MSELKAGNSSRDSAQLFDIQGESGQQAKSPGSSWLSAPGKLFGRNLKIGIDFSSIGKSLYQGLMGLRESVVRNFTSNNKKTVEATASWRKPQQYSEIEMVSLFDEKINEILPEHIVSGREKRAAYLNQLNEDDQFVKTPRMMRSAQGPERFFPTDSESDAGIAKLQNRRCDFGVGPDDVVPDEKEITRPIEKNVYEAEIEESSLEL